MITKEDKTVRRKKSLKSIFREIIIFSLQEEEEAGVKKLEEELHRRVYFGGILHDIRPEVGP